MSRLFVLASKILDEVYVSGFVWKIIHVVDCLWKKRKMNDGKCKSMEHGTLLYIAFYKSFYVNLKRQTVKKTHTNQRQIC